MRALVFEADVLAWKTKYLVVDELDATTGWSVGTLDTVNFRSGGAGLKLSPTASTTVTATKPTSVLNMSGVGVADEIRFWVYIDAIANLDNIKIEFVDGIPVTATLTRTAAQLVQGWNRISIAKSAFTNSNTINWSSVVTRRLIVVASAAGTVNATFDMLRIMISPIGYTSGLFDETTGLADLVDNQLKFFNSGYWQVTHVNINPASLYRLIGTATVTLAEGYARLSGLNAYVTVFELITVDDDTPARLEHFSPKWYRNSAVMQAIWGAQGSGVGQFLATIHDSFRQSFIKLATYRLPLLENVYGSGDATAANLSMAKRRLRVLARSTQPTAMNIVGMRRLVENYVTSAVVTHTPATYTFTVQIIDPKGEPANLVEIQEAIERAKPAHLGYTITYTFLTWNDKEALNQTWNSADTQTWNQFEVS